jgi:adenosine deaminase
MGRFLVLLLLFPLGLSACSMGAAPVTAPGGAPRSADQAFQAARQDPNALRAFLLEMPKGGDLHHHLTGAVYPEVLIQLASYEGLSVDLASSSVQQCQGVPGTHAGIPIAAPTADCGACADASSCATPATRCMSGTKTLTGSFVPACCLCSNSALYDNFVNALSMRGQPWGTLAAHDHFFAIFDKLGPAAYDAPSVLAQLRQQASRESVLYLESMSSALRPPGEELTSFQALFSAGDSSPGAAFCKQLMAGPLDTSAIGDDGRKVLAAADALGRQTAAAMAGQIDASSKLLGCETHPDAPGCEVTVRRQIEMHRTLIPIVICQEALLGFAASHADRRHMVGINIVAAEDAYLARINYLPDMNLIGNLGRIYPEVGRALHAGELAEGLVPPNDLRFHIAAAVCTAGAERIGHAVDVTYEADSEGLLRELAGGKRSGSCTGPGAAGPVAIEINLVSNAQLLGVQGREHPLPLYVARGVPVVLATDDPGIMRTSLTEQYRVAGLDYPKLRYSDLRTFNRNSLEFSFLTGASIWEDSGAYRRPVAACRAAAGGLDLDRCATWARSQGDKAQLQVELERRLRRFESKFE